MTALSHVSFSFALPQWCRGERGAVPPLGAPQSRAGFLCLSPPAVCQALRPGLCSELGRGTWGQVWQEPPDARRPLARPRGLAPSLPTTPPRSEPPDHAPHPEPPDHAPSLPPPRSQTTPWLWAPGSPLAQPLVFLAHCGIQSQPKEASGHP